MSGGKKFSPFNPGLSSPSDRLMRQRCKVSMELEIAIGESGFSTDQIAAACGLDPATLDSLFNNCGWSEIDLNVIERALAAVQSLNSTTH